MVPRAGLELACACARDLEALAEVGGNKTLRKSYAGPGFSAGRHALFSIRLNFNHGVSGSKPDRLPAKPKRNCEFLRLRLGHRFVRRRLYGKLFDLVGNTHCSEPYGPRLTLNMSPQRGPLNLGSLGPVELRGEMRLDLRLPQQDPIS
jgi:hypothetical protein